jgi:hypothetical protein
VEFAGQSFQAAAELGDVLDAVAGGVLGAHQLQVVDDDESEVVVPNGDLTGLRAELEQGEVAVVEQGLRRLSWL